MLQVSCTCLFHVLAVKLYGKGVITIDIVRDRKHWVALNETVYFSSDEEMQICEALEAACIGMEDSQALVAFTREWQAAR